MEGWKVGGKQQEGKKERDSRILDKDLLLVDTEKIETISPTCM